MAGSRLRARVDGVAALRGAGEAEAIPALRKALADRTGIVVAEAAKVSAARRLGALLPDVEAALDRFLAAPVEDDRGCLAKVALTDACDELGSVNEPLFRRAVRCVHREPAWGGPADRAATVRVRALFALFRLRHPEAMREAARLLADEDPTARAGAATAAANGSPLEGVPLLRHHVYLEDADLRVTEAALDALLALDPEGSVAFAAELLQAPREEVADLAAAALGGSRLEAARVPLIRWAEQVPERRARVAYVALALLRSEPATAYLLDIVRDAAEERALLAAEALAPFARDVSLAGRLRDAAADRAPVARAVARSLRGQEIP